MKRIALAVILLAGTTVPVDARASAADRSCYRHVRSAAQRELVRRESSGNPHAKNRRSSAMGCGQLIAAQRRHYGRRLGINPNTTDAAAQMQLMSAYSTERYGSDARALAHHNARGWY